MYPRLVRSILSLSAIVIPVAVSAQHRGAQSGARLTPYVGYMAFGSLADGPLGTRLGNRGAPVYGVQLGIDLVPAVALVGNIGYADSNLEVGMPILGGLSIADTKVLMYDAGLQVRLPSLSRYGTGVVPYAEGGLGAIRYEVSAGSISTRSTNVAANFGGGVDLQLNRAIGLRIMAKDYVGKFDYREATGLGLSGKTTHNIAFGMGLTLGF